MSTTKSDTVDNIISSDPDEVDSARTDHRTTTIPQQTRSTKTTTAIDTGQDGAPPPPTTSSTSSSSSSSSSPPSAAPAALLLPPPPNGGFRAWAQVAVAHLGSFNSWGYMNSFGLFQAYYTTTLPASITPSAISWIGSIQIFLAFGVGSVSGRALDMGYLRPCLALGCALQILAIMSASSAEGSFWQLLLSQGICKGLGDGLVFCPTVANIPTYFSPDKRRAVAMSVAAAGTATGGVVFPVVAQRLMPVVGYAWTVRVMGFIVLVNSGVMLGLVRARYSRSLVREVLSVAFAGPVGRKEKKDEEDGENGEKGEGVVVSSPRSRRLEGGFFEWSAFRDEPPYALLCAGMFCVWLALYFAFYYVTPFAKTHIGIETSTSLTILLIMNAIGAPSRIFFGFIADKFLGALHTLILGALATGVMFFSWAAVTDLSGLYVFCCLYGFFAASCQGLFPASCANLTKDPKRLGARTGMAFAVVSIATLVGPPVGGALVQLRQSRYQKEGEDDRYPYLYAQVFGGSVLMLGAGLLGVASWLRRKGRLIREGGSE